MDSTWQRNVRFNRMVSALPKRSLVIARMADGSVRTVEVSSLTPENGASK
jgi:hypothetical protein